MGIITTATRMWLTRSVKGFDFKPVFSNDLNYIDAKNLGLYVHIPFCRKICKFCPYCKEVYVEQKCDRYIDYLIKEIHLVGKNLQNHKNKEKKIVTSLYFGGGTPALAQNRIKEIIDALKEYFYITDGIGIELHPENVTVDTLKNLKSVGVTKISIGIQSFQDKFLDILGRGKTDYSSMFKAIKEVEFETVAMDFIFALPNQKIEDLISDVEYAYKNGANHVAIYPFIDFGFIDSKIPTMSKNEKRKLLDDITDYCESKGYKRDSIWTFSKNGKSKYSSMTRDNFLGFGCSATTALHDVFKINTFDTESYIERIENGNLPTSLTLDFSERQRMIYYLFWVMYSTEVNPEKFEEFFGKKLETMYGFEFSIARILGFLKKENGIYKLTKKGAFYYHHYENYYTYDYINSMWGLMSKEAFPKKLEI